MTIRCDRCIKAIRIEEWESHLDWHRRGDDDEAARAALRVIRTEPEPIIA
jgi:hypothetical protein